VARNETFIAAPPERLFAILADGWSYPGWVVGARKIRAVDEGFPAVGKRFHHMVGVGPLKVADHTEVVDVDPPRRLQLRARARPLGVAHVTLLLEPSDGGTKVTMIEEPADRTARLLHNPLSDLLIRLRNAESLRRLRKLAESG
jgi:uncharacterized protein YndB with AHSA1/START domain